MHPDHHPEQSFHQLTTTELLERDEYLGRTSMVRWQEMLSTKMASIYHAVSISPLHGPLALRSLALSQRHFFFPQDYFFAYVSSMSPSTTPGRASKRREANIVKNTQFLR